MLKADDIPNAISHSRHIPAFSTAVFGLNSSCSSQSCVTTMAGMKESQEFLFSRIAGRISQCSKSGCTAQFVGELVMKAA